MGGANSEGTATKLPYPKSVFFIISNEFCERFSFYGMKTVLTLFLTRVLLFSENVSTEIYHAFVSLCYFTPIFGAMLADSFLGKYRTILYLSLVYVTGNAVLSISSIPGLGSSSTHSGHADSSADGPPGDAHTSSVRYDTMLAMLGLLLIGIGTGGIKPCVAAFGGDQFKLPQQALQLATFFSVFYFSINAGSLVSTFLTPQFRNLQCFGQDCYVLAFSVPAVLMVVALIIFVAGKRTYVIKQSEGNVIKRVAKCIVHAISRRSQSGVSRDHWLDYADDEYDKSLIQDIKIILKLFVLYIPLPFFWALFDQQGSRWTFQATRMTGELAFGYEILPDQMQIVNPLLILFMIPVFDQLIYPCFGKVGVLKKPLQRLTIGGVLAGIAFIISGIVEFRIQAQYPVQLQPEVSTLNFINSIPCSMALDLTSESGNSTNTRELLVHPNKMAAATEIPAGMYSLRLKYVPETGNKSSFDCKNWSGWDKTNRIEALAGNSTSHVLGLDANKNFRLVSSATPDKISKDGKGDSFAKIFYFDLDPSVEAVAFEGIHTTLFKLSTRENGQTNFTALKQIEYMVTLKPGDKQVGKFSPKLEGNYVLTVQKNPVTGDMELHEHTIVEPNTVHMFWLLPQYIIITMGEVMFSVTGLEFSYTQAPASMKSVVQAAWLLTVAFGNVLVLVISGAHFFHEQSKEFFLFAGLMFFDMLIFAILALRYKPVHSQQEVEEMIPVPPTSGQDYINKGFEHHNM